MAIAVLCFTLYCGMAPAGPEGGQVVSGEGAIHSADGHTRVDQRSRDMVVDWRRFDLEREESVHFEQADAGYSVLNRIHDSKASQIWGRITARGHVWLLNPNGVFFNRTARVNVGGLTAAGLWMKREDFMAGRYVLENGRGAGPVVNEGEIGAAGGGVGLFGLSVVNKGRIRAVKSKVVLASGEKVALDFAGDGLLRFALSEGIAGRVDGAATVVNTGEVEAGEIEMAVRTAGNVLTGVVNNEGVLRARRLTRQGGVVRLDGGESGEVRVGGVVDVSGEDGGAGGRMSARGENLEQVGEIRADGVQGGEVDLVAAKKARAGGVIRARGVPETERAAATVQGGRITVQAEEVHVDGNAVLEASGERAGGEILVGGDWQGKNPEIRNARRTTVESGAELKADASRQGDGGKIVVWADETTDFAGHISARGGAGGGDGGQAEVSGKEHLRMRGLADLSAPAGRSGHLLLDPGSVRICDGAGSACTASGMDVFEDDAIATQLGTASVTISTTDANTGDEDITVETGVSVTWTTGNTLTLTAGEDISLAGAFTGTNGTLDLNFGGMLDLGAASLSVGRVTADGAATGTQTIEGQNADTTWTLTGSGAGTVTAGTQAITFSEVESLSGGAMTDTLDLSSLTTTTTISLSGISAAGYAMTVSDDTASLASLSNIDSVSGSGQSDTLQGLTVSHGNMISVTSDDAGVYRTAIDPADPSTLTELAFSSVENLSSRGDTSDTLVISAELSGSVEMAGGADDVTVQTGGRVRGSIDLGPGADVLTLEDQAMAMMPIARVDSGISAGEGDDELTFGQRSRVDGMVQGQGNDDTFFVMPDATISGSLAGGSTGETTDSGTDMLNLSGVGDTMDATTKVSLTVTGKSGTGYTGNVTGGASITFTGMDEAEGGMRSDDIFIGLNETSEFHVTLDEHNNSSFSYVTDDPDSTDPSDRFSFDFSNFDIIQSGSATDDSLHGPTPNMMDHVVRWNVNDETPGNESDIGLYQNDGTSLINGLGEFTGIEILYGAGSKDDFRINADFSRGIVHGGDGDDTIRIDAAIGSAGTRVAGACSTQAGDVCGGGGADSFIIGSGAMAHGLLDGGAGDDHLDMSGLNAALTVALSAVGADGFDGSASGGAAIGFTGLNEITGGMMTDTLQGLDTAGTLDTADTFTLGATDSYTTSYADPADPQARISRTLTFASLENMQGGDGADVFRVSGAHTGTLDGGGGMDSLQGPDANTAWTVSGTSVTVGTDTYTFSSIEVLQGGSMVDTFTVSSASNYDLSGGDGADVFNINAELTGGVSGEGGDDTVNVGMEDMMGTVTMGGVTGNISLGAGDDTFVSTAGMTGGNVSGGADGDTFDINGGTIGGTLSGGAGDDHLDMSGLNAALTVALSAVGADGFDGSASGGAAIDFTGLNEITGGMKTDTLQGLDTAGTFNLGATDSYTTSYMDPVNQDVRISRTLSFASLEDMEGGSAVDTFMVTGGQHTGDLNGGGGDDRFGFDAMGRLTGRMDGETGRDTIFGIDPTSGGLTWDVGIRISIGGHAISPNAPSHIEVIEGGAGENTFTVSAEVDYDLVGNAMRDVFRINDRLTGSVTGGDGNDEVRISSSFGVEVLDVTLGEGNDEFVFDTAGGRVRNVAGNGGNDTFEIIRGTVTEMLSGDAGDDHLDMAGLNAALTVTLSTVDADGFDGSVTGGAVIEFTGLDEITGGMMTDTLQGLNTDSTFTLGATDSYTTSYTDMGAMMEVSRTLSFASLENLTGGSAADVFSASRAHTGTLAGGGGTDILQGPDADTAWTVSGTSVTVGTNTYTFSSIEALQGGSMVDTFTVSAASDYDLSGGDGADVFNINAALDGGVSGGDGADEFNINAALDDGVSGGDGADEFNINAALDGGVSGGDGADVFNINAALDGGVSGGEGDDTVNVNTNGYVNNNIALGAGDDTFVLNTGFSVDGNVSGGGDNDTFEITGGAISGTLSGDAGNDIFDINDDGFDDTVTGGAGDDHLDMAGLNAALIASLSAVDADGFDGTVTGGTALAFTFTGIGEITGGMMTDGLQGLNTASTFTLGATDSYMTSYTDMGTMMEVSRTLSFASLEDMQGGSGVDTFRVTGGQHTGDLNGGGGDDRFGFDAMGMLMGRMDGGTDRNTIFGIDPGPTPGGLTWDIGVGITLESNTIATAIENIQVIEGGEGTNTFTVSAAADYDLVGNALKDVFRINDRLTGSVTGGDGNDEVRISSTSGEVTLDVTLGEGNDEFVLDTASGRVRSVAGNGGNDTFEIIRGTVTRALSGDAGDDHLDMAGLNAALTVTLSTVDADGFDGSVTGGAVIAFTGLDEITGGMMTDTLQGLDTASTFALGATDSYKTSYTDTGAMMEVSRTLSLASLENMQGGSAADTFAVTAAHTGDLSGGGGDDRLYMAGLNAALTVALSAVDADGFAGSVSDGAMPLPNVNFTFTGIDEITGGMMADTLQGLNTDSTFTLGAMDSYETSYTDMGTMMEVSRTLSLVSLEDMEGGSAADTFTVTAAHTGDLSGGGGDDHLDMAGLNAALTVALSGTPDADGFAGSVSDGAMPLPNVNFTFTGIDEITGGMMTDTLQGLNTASTFTLGATASYANNSRTLSFASLEDMEGGSAADVFTVTAPHTGDLSGGGGDDHLDMAGLNAALTVALSGTPDADGFAGSVSGGATITFTGIDEITGGMMTDTLQGLNTASTFTLGTMASYANNSRTLSFASLEDMEGGSAADTFTVTAAHTGDLSGGGGDDHLNMAGLNAALTVALSGTPDANGFAGSVSDGAMPVPNVNLTFTGIDEITGGMMTDTLQGLNTASTFTLGTTDSYGNNSRTLPFASLEDMEGGSADDTFTVTAAHTGDLSGGGGDDHLNMAGLNAALTVALSGTPDADGFAGSVSDGAMPMPNVNLTFTGIDEITGGMMTDTLQGLNTDSTFTLGAADSYENDSRTLSFASLEDMEGGSAADVFTVTAHRGDLSGGGGNDVYTLTAALTGRIDAGAGEDMVNVNAGGSVSGGVDTGSEDDTLTVAGGSVMNGVTLGSGGDRLTVNSGSVSGGVSGGAGDDSFDIDGGSIGGTVAGGADDDHLDMAGLNAALTVALSGTPDADGFAGSVSGGATIAFTGIDEITGGMMTDTLQGLNTASTFTLGTADSYENDSRTLSFASLEDMEGGSAADIFTVTEAHRGDLSGGGGNDVYTLTAALTGRVDAGAGEDMVNVNTGGSVSGGVDTGSEDDTLTVAGGSVMNGVTLGSGDDRLTVNSGSVSGGVSGGAGDDSFDIDGGSIGGTVAGGADDDHLDMAGLNAALTVALSGSPDADGFAGSVSGGATIAFTGIDEITGGMMTDTLQGLNTAGTFTLGTMASYANNSRTLSLASLENMEGGSAADTFTVTAAHTGDLSGGGGDDHLDMAGLNAALTVALSGTPDADGFAGSVSDGAMPVPNVNLMFTGIDEITGGMMTDTLQGLNTASTFTLGTTDSYGNNSRTLPFASLEDMEGGSAADTFTVTAAHTGDLSGGGGDDHLDMSGLNAALTVALSGTPDADGFAGSVSDGAMPMPNVNLTFTGIDEITGGMMTDTLQGLNTAGTFTLGTTDSYENDSRTLSFASLEDMEGGSAADVFTVTEAHRGDLSGGGGNDVYTLTAALTGRIDAGAGEDMVNVNTSGSVSGGVDTGSEDDTLTVAGGSVMNGVTLGSGGDRLTVNSGSISGGVSAGAGDDSFDIDGGSIGGTVAGGADDDHLDMAGLNAALTVALSGTPDADGFAGSVSGGATIAFTGIDEITGGMMTDTLQGLNTAGTFTLGAADSYENGSRTLSFASLEDMEGGSAADIFTVTEAHRGDLSGGGGNDVYTLTAALTGRVDAGAGEDMVNVNTGGSVSGGVDAGSEDDTLTVAGGSVMNGVTLGSGGDRLTVNSGSVSGGVSGGAGDDSFDIDGGSIGGTVAGGADDDHLDMAGLNAALTVALSGTPDADGFAGSVSGGATIAFTGVDEITGGMMTDTLQGLNTASTFTLGAADRYENDSRTLSLASLEDMEGGSAADVFTVTAAHTGDLSGGGGDDHLDMAGLNAALTVALSGTPDADGFAGSVSDKAMPMPTFTFTFTGIDEITGGMMTDTLQGLNTASTFTLGTTDSYENNSRTLSFASLEDMQGGAVADIFRVTDERHTGSLSGGDGDDQFGFDAMGRLTGRIDGEMGRDTIFGIDPSSGGLTWDVGILITIGGHAISPNNPVGIEVIEGGAGENAFTVSADVAYDLIGNAMRDNTFQISAAELTGSITGGDGVDMVRIDRGGNVTGNITLDEGDDRLVLDTGTIGGGISGGAGDDTFDIDGGSLRGTVDGGADNDHLDMAGLNAALIVALSGTPDADGFAGSVNGVSAFPVTFTGIDEITGGMMTDTLRGLDTDSTFTLGATDSYANNSRTLSFASLENMEGGSAANTFMVTAAHTGDLSGGGGDDHLDMAGLNAALTVALSGTPDADGFAGSVSDGAMPMPNVNFTFTGIDEITGGMMTDTLQGLNTDSTFTLGATDSYENDSRTLSLASLEDMEGGSAADTFTVTAAHTGNLSGGGGDDHLDMAGLNAALTVALSGTPDADGFAGSVSDGAMPMPNINLMFTGIDEITGGMMTDTLQGLNTDSTFTLGTTDSYENDSRTLSFASLENMEGGSAADTFTVTAAHTRDLSGGGGDDHLDMAGLNAALTVALSGTPDADGFAGSVSGGATIAFTGIDEITGGMMTDTLQGLNTDSTFTLGATDSYENDSRTLSLASLENMEGGSAADVFTVTAAHTGDLSGGGGDDHLDMAGLNAALTVALSGTPDANGFAGSVSGGATITFTGIDEITGGMMTDTLQGLNTASTFTLGAADSYENDSRTLSFASLEDMEGGSAADVFTVTAAHTGNLSGGGGDDHLDMAGLNAALTVALSGTPDADGFAGSVSDGAMPMPNITFMFTGIDEITGGMMTDTLQGLNTASTFTLGAADSYENDSRTLSFASLEDMEGGSAADTFTVAAAHTGDLSGGGGNDVYTLTAALTGRIDAGAGEDMVNVNTGGSVSGGVDTGSEDDTLTVAGGSVMNGVTLGSGGDRLTVNSGSVSGGVSGGAGDDSFDISGGSVMGTVDGGADNDHLDMAGLNAALTVALSGTPDADGFAGSVSGGATIAFTGVDEITGGMMTDTLQGLNTASTFTLGTADSYENDSRTLSLASLEDMEGGSAADTFTVTAAHTGDLSGGGGNDVYTLTAALTGRIDAGAGEDMVNVNTGGSVSGGVDAGSEDDTLTVAGGSVMNGVTLGSGDDSLTVNSGSVSGGVSAGAGDDSFDIDGGSIGGTVAGGADDDHLDMAGLNAALTVALSGTPDADGFAGSVSGGATIAFTGIDEITGGMMTDTLQGLNTAGTFTLGAADSYENDSRTLSFASLEDMEGGSAADTFTVTAAHTGDLSGGGGNDVYTLTAALTGRIDAGAGEDMVNVNTGGSVSGGVDTGSEDDTLTVAGGSVMNGVTLGSGGDRLTVNSGSISGGVSAGAGDDTLTVAGGSVMNGVTLGSGGDSLTVNSGSVSGGVSAGAGDDSFDISGGSVMGTVDGGADNDHLDMAGLNAALTVALSGTPDADGFAGSVSGGATIAFTGIDEITGGMMTDTLQGLNTAGTFTLGATGTTDPMDRDSYENDSRTLSFASLEDMEGGSAADTFTVTAAHTGDLTGDGANDIFIIDALVTGSIFGSAGMDRFEYGNDGGVTGLLDGGVDNDTWQGSPSASTYTLSSDNGGSYEYELEQGTFGARFSNIENIIAGIGQDTLVVDDGGSLAGSFDGGSGDNILNYGNYSSPVTIDLTGIGSGGMGFMGMATALAGGFDRISVAVGATGAMDVLNGIVSESGTFSADLVVVPGDIVMRQGGIYTNDGSGSGGQIRNLRYRGFEVFGAGDQGDLFDSTLLQQGIVRGGRGLDRITLAGLSEDVIITLTGLDLDTGYHGRIGDNIEFSGVDIIIGGGSMDDRITGLPGGGMYEVYPLSDPVISNLIGDTDDFDEGSYRGFGNDGNPVSRVLYLDSVESLHGSGGNDIFLIREGGLTSGTLHGADGFDILNFRGVTSAVTLIVSELGGQAHIDAGGLRTIVGRTGREAAPPLEAIDATYWNSIEKLIGAEPAGGSGTYLVVQPSTPDTDLIINEDGRLPATGVTDPDNTVVLALPDVIEFPGHVFIGGASPPRLPVNAAESFDVPLVRPEEPLPENPTVEMIRQRERDRNPTRRLTIATTLLIPGSLGLFASSIDLMADIASGVNTGLSRAGQLANAPDGGEEVLIVAHGFSDTLGNEAPQENGSLTPVLTGTESERSIYASGGLIATSNIIRNATDLLIDFRAGPLQFAQGRAASVVLNPAGNFVGASLTADIEAFFERIGLTVVELVLSIFNPASSLVITGGLTYIDTGLFEEELTLFSAVGRGLALALAQCEELEGCAPNVTEEGLEEFIEKLNQRIVGIKQDMADPNIGERGKTKLRELLADYEDQLQSFLGYQEELQRFLYGESPEEEDAFSDEGLPAEFFTDEPDNGTIPSPFSPGADVPGEKISGDGSELPPLEETSPALPDLDDVLEPVGENGSPLVTPIRQPLE